MKSEAAYVSASSGGDFALYLYVNQSLEAVASLSRFCELAHVAAEADISIPFIVLDFSSELMTPFWVKMNHWFDQQGVHTLGYRGYGKIIWVRGGTVVHWQYKLRDSSIESLIDTGHHIYNGNHHITK